MTIYKFAKLWTASTMLGIGFVGATLQAQTLFHTYDTIPTLSRYLSAEECLAASSRVSEGLILARSEFADTMMFRIGEGKDSTALSVIAIAKQCSEKFNPDSVVLTGYVESYADWMRLYLIANRDDAASIIAQRRIANAKQNPKLSNELYDVLSGITDVYGGVRPMRWEKMKAIGAQLEESGVIPGPIEMYKTYFARYRFAETVDDTIVQTQMAERMIALAEAAPPELRERREFIMVQYINFMALSFLNRHVRMDSLRSSPEAYISLSLQHWKNLTKDRKLPTPMMIGEEALPVNADFWYSANNSASADQANHIRPTPGKVSLVVFLRQGCSEKSPMFFGEMDRGTFLGQCWATYSILRRLVQRFPSLEITIVSRTTGYISETGLMSPQEEADILQKWWLGYHKLPATLAVTNTQFFRLEGFDRRRIDETVENDVNYLFGQPGRGKGDEVDAQNAFLVDTNGRVIHSGTINVQEEKTIREMLNVIGQRGSVK